MRSLEPSRWQAVEISKKIAKLLGVAEGLDVRVVLPLGHPESQVEQKGKKPFEERAWFNRWGGVPVSEES